MPGTLVRHSARQGKCRTRPRRPWVSARGDREASPRNTHWASGAGRASGRMAGMPTALKPTIIDLVSGIEPTDDLGREHRSEALSWLAATGDIFRRGETLPPSPHLV